MNRNILVLAAGIVLSSCAESKDSVEPSSALAAEGSTGDGAPEPESGDLPEDTGEESPQESEEEEQEEDTGLGEADGPEEEICALAEREAASFGLPASLEEAAQLVLVPAEGESYLLDIPIGGEGWFVLEVPSWMCDVELYTEQGVLVEMEPSDDWDLGDVAVNAAECGSVPLYRHSWTFHAWGSYIVRVQAEGATEIWLGTVLIEGV
jgi:hypothetical protein